MGIFSKRWQPRDKNLTTNIEFYTYKGLTTAYKYCKKSNNLPTIVFFYGFGGNIEMLQGLAPLLAEKYSLIIFDYPGHCYSPEPDKFDLNKYIELIIDFVINQNINEIYLVGYSFGGVASLLFYKRLKDRIKKFVLLHSDTNFSYNIIKRIFYLNFHLFLKINFRLTIVYLAIPVLRDKYFTKDLYKKAKEIIMYNKPKNVINNYASIIYKDFTYLLKEISTPTLIIGSKVDFLISTKRSKYIHSNIKNSSLMIYDDIGHLSIVSRYERVAKDILLFFND